MAKCKALTGSAVKGLTPSFVVNSRTMHYEIWPHKTGNITLSCSISINSSTRCRSSVWQTYRRTDRITI